MLISFFFILPQGPLHTSLAKLGDYEAIDDLDAREQDDEPCPEGEDDGLLSSSMQSSRSFSAVSNKGKNSAWTSFKANLRRSRGLFFPFMLPLLLVYIAGRS
jgi:battenin